MRYRESGMPDENMWSAFFEPDKILSMMEIDNEINVLIDIGCGYGTFLFPASQVVKQIIGLDIDDQMIAYCDNLKKEQALDNVSLIVGDISQKNILDTVYSYVKKVDYITLFNILHCEEPIKLLQTTYDILGIGGKVGVIHWKQENTPRGPSMDIRPTPQQIINWADSAGFKTNRQVNLPPFHYGVILYK